MIINSAVHCFKKKKKKTILQNKTNANGVKRHTISPKSVLRHNSSYQIIYYNPHTVQSRLSQYIQTKTFLTKCNFTKKCQSCRGCFVNKHTHTQSSLIFTHLVLCVYLQGCVCVCVDLIVQLDVVKNTRRSCEGT